jgi:hypothetical protein
LLIKKGGLPVQKKCPPKASLFSNTLNYKCMQNRKLAELLQKVEANQANESQDELFNINDELAKNLRAVYGGGNGDCSNNTSCNNNGTCHNNPSCNGNGTCQGKAVIEVPIDPIAS